jgi:hypothetical protein
VWARAPLRPTCQPTSSLRAAHDMELPPIPLLAAPDVATIPVAVVPHRVGPIALCAAAAIGCSHRCTNAHACCCPLRRRYAREKLLPDKPCASCCCQPPAPPRCRDVYSRARRPPARLPLGMPLRHVATVAPHLGHLPTQTPTQGQESLPSQHPLQSAATLCQHPPFCSACAYRGALAWVVR